MAQKTEIEWTDASSNPLKYRDRETGRDVWACVKHSPGCANCYSEALAARFGRGGPFTKAEMAKVEPYACPKELRRLVTSKSLAGKRVFVGDMTDLFGDWVPDEILTRIFVHMAYRRDVTSQVLTKRADRLADFILGIYGRYVRIDIPGVPLNWEPFDWPPRNVWLGTSVENQATADERIPHLLRVPAAVRFLSVEPLLGPVDLSRIPMPGGYQLDCLRGIMRGTITRDIQPCEKVAWVIVGGESGHNARPCRVEWIRSILQQCRDANVPCFVKQLGGNVVTRNDTIEDVFGNGETGWPEPDVEHDIHGFREEYQGADCRIRLRNKKGGDPAEWPEDLRVREFPQAGG